MSEPGISPTDVAGDLSDQQVRRAEAHRGFVREMDQVLGKAYGTGGALVIGAAVAVLVVGWWLGWLTSPLLWVPGVTGVLGALYLVRRWIYARRDRLRRRVETYCETNDISPQVLEQHYRTQDMYPFFLAIFETRPRRLSDNPRATER